MIEIKNISKKFGKLQALDGLNLNLNYGECIALIGPNGCGKTTLIKSILGMVIPDEGDIIFDNTSIKNDINYRNQTGYMPQIGRYPENMTIGQVWDMMRDIRQTKNTKPDEELIEKFEDKLGTTIGAPLAGYFQDVLKNQPSPENNYLKQMSKVKNEKELDVLYREIFAYMSKHYHVSALTGAAKLVGQDFAEKLNPITTLGSMQVHIN